MSESAVHDLSYEIELLHHQPVFRGTYSDVYEGKWRGRKVAIKVIKTVSTTHTMRRKFYREKEVWGHLKHPNIALLCGYAEGGPHFGDFGALISPWYLNGDSAHYLARYGETLSLAERLQLFQGVTQGIRFLHEHSPVIIHGDVKPGNILVDADGVAKLCDFGLVQVLFESTTTGMTTTSTYTGTPRYMAPELVNSESEMPTAASDIWSLGCVGLEFIFRIQPYARRSHNARGHIFEDIRSGIAPADMSESLDFELSAIWDIMQDCWTDPSFRPTASWILIRLNGVGIEQVTPDSGVDKRTLLPDFSSPEAPPYRRPSDPMLFMNEEAAEYERVRVQRLRDLTRQNKPRHKQHASPATKTSDDRREKDTGITRGGPTATSPGLIHCMKCLNEEPVTTLPSCAHTVCKVCLKTHIVEQLLENHWPIVCPLCKDLPGRQPSVIRRQLAEEAGLEDEFMLNFDRAELKSGSIIVECPGCRLETRVYAVNLQNPIVVCCIDCSVAWCTKCSRAIDDQRSPHRC